MTDVATDLRFAFRALRARPMLSMVAVLSLGLAIGAGTTVFGLFDAVWLRPLAIADPEELVHLHFGSEAQPYGSWTYTDFIDAAELRPDLWRGTTASGDWQFDLAREQGTQLVDGQLVSSNYFSLLGAGLALGRSFTPGDPTRPVATHAQEVVLGHDLWQRAFGGTPDVLGQTVRLAGQPFTIVGVAEAGFHGLQLGDPAEMWVPLGNYGRLATGFFAAFDAARYDPSRSGPRFGLWNVVGRRADGVTLAECQAAMAWVAARLTAIDAPNDPRRITAESASAAATPAGNRASTRRFLLLLAAAVAAMLGIACSNVAHLQLVRATDRREEIAVRLALGCRRGRLIRQLLTESALLAGFGSLAGLLLAVWAFDLLAAFELPGGILVASLGLSFSPGLLAFVAGLGLLTTLFFGTVPALQAAGRRGNARLVGRAATAGNRRLQNSLIVVQVALSVLLLVGAGLLLRSVARAFDSDLGFDAAGLSGLTVDPSMARYGAHDAVGLLDRLAEDVGALPGVTDVAMTTTPFGRRGTTIRGLKVEGRDMDPQLHYGKSWVGRGFFATMGIPLLAGRPFDEREKAATMPAVIINQTLARTLWGDENPIGKRLALGGERKADSWVEVVGMVADSRYWSLRQADQAYLYLPLEQHPAAATRGALSLLIRSPAEKVSPNALLAAVTAIDPALPVVGVWTMRSRIASLMMPERMGSVVLGLFASAALILAAIGMAATVAHAVVRQQREIGVRMALGAQVRTIVGGFTRHHVAATVVGLVIGLVCAASLAHTLQAFLYEIEPLDLATYGGVALLMLVVATVASVLPARAAAQVDPLIALRHD